MERRISMSMLRQVSARSRWLLPVGAAATVLAHLFSVGPFDSRGARGTGCVGRRPAPRSPGRRRRRTRLGAIGAWSRGRSRAEVTVAL